MNFKLFSQAFLFALGAASYVSIVGASLYTMPKIDLAPGPLGPVAVLMLLVLSVSMMGLLLFGRPVYLYFEGRKTEAVTFVLCTVASFAFITLSVIAFVFLNYGPRVF